MDISNEIIISAKNFDEYALNVIFEEFKPYMKNMAFKYFMTGADRDDVIQESMIALFCAIKTYDESRECDFVVFAKNCIDLRLKSAVKMSLRKKHTPLNQSIPLYNDGKVYDEYIVDDPEKQFIDNESYEIANKNLRALLSPFELCVFSLLELGLSYKEIALKLEKNPHCIDNALQRIKKKARKIFI